MLLGPILQIAYVTADIDGACAHLGQKLGLHKFLRAGPNTIEADDGTSMTLKLAHAWLAESGGLLIAIMSRKLAEALSISRPGGKHFHSPD